MCHWQKYIFRNLSMPRRCFVPRRSSSPRNFVATAAASRRSACTFTGVDPVRGGEKERPGRQGESGWGKNYGPEQREERRPRMQKNSGSEKNAERKSRKQKKNLCRVFLCVWVSGFPHKLTPRHIHVFPSTTPSWNPLLPQENRKCECVVDLPLRLFSCFSQLRPPSHPPPVSNESP